MDTIAKIKKEIVEKAKKEIIEDIQKGVIPSSISSFGELHEYVDANCYGGICDDDYIMLCNDDDIDTINDIQTTLSRWLKKADFEIQTIEFDGLHYQLWKYAKNDYSVWTTDDLNDSSSGCSVRGTFNQVTEDCKEIFEHLICL